MTNVEEAITYEDTEDDHGPFCSAWNPEEINRSVGALLTVLKKWRSKDHVTASERVWASYGLGVSTAALVQTFDPAQVVGPIGIEEALIGMDDALIAIAMLSEHYASVFETRLDLFRKPRSFPGLPEEIRRRQRVATDEEVRELVQPIIEALLARAAVLRDAHGTHILPRMSYFEAPSSPWPLVAPSAPVALYRWYDEDNRLIYVGITNDLSYRQTSHAKRSSWSHFAARCTVERFPDRASAEDAEVAAIKSEQPLFNQQHNDTPEARQRLVDYLVEKGRTDLLAPAISRG